MLLIASTILAFDVSQLAYGQSSNSLEKATIIHYDPIIRRLIVYIQESLPKELGNTTATVVVWRRPDSDLHEIARGYFEVTEKGGFIVMYLPEISDGRHEVFMTMKASPSVGYMGSVVYRTFEHQSNDVVSKLPELCYPSDIPFNIFYYPSLKKLTIKVPNLLPEMIKGHKHAEINVISKNDDINVINGEFVVTERGGEITLDLPKLSDGIYETHISVDGFQEGIKSFRHIDFPWVNNDLGEINKVYLPFTPIEVKDNVVSVVLRSYQMNGFGLWDSVISDGKEILASPILLKVQTDSGEEKWQFGKSEWIEILPHTATYQTEAISESVQLKTKSTIEYDGCMKVEMDLLPSDNAKEIKQMWLEIPLKDKEAPLFHYCAMEGMRRNYAGKTPIGGKIKWEAQPFDKIPPQWEGGTLPPVWKAVSGSDDGILWTCRDIYPWTYVMESDFVPYIWLGGGERGLAFFGENDKGYILDPKGTAQKIERKGETLFLRIDLINKPSIIKTPHHITFGLQVSPTRPMPEGWRTDYTVPPHGGPVVCWGGYVCSDKYPDGRNFRIPEEIIKVRNTGIEDRSVFEKFDKERERFWDKPFGEAEWVTSCMWFVGMAKGIYNGRNWENIAKGIYPEMVAKRFADAPMVTYFEEHDQDIVSEEWEIYQDEWRALYPWTARNKIEGQQHAERALNHGRLNFPESYIDFALYYANEWMKRGIGLYFDNTMPYIGYDPMTSEAFYDDRGILHPACTLWEQREYYKRIWTLMQELKSKGTSAPIAYTQHSTNTRILPLNTWNDASLDIEWGWHEEGNGYKWCDAKSPIPFPHDLILAETVGRQTGSLSHSHMGLNGWFGKHLETPERARTEWGMRMVHEIIRGTWPWFTIEVIQKLEKAIWDFGYGTDECLVINYWSDDPPIAVSDPEVKWLLLMREKDRSFLLVLQSWHKNGIDIEIKIDSQRLSSANLYVETGNTIPIIDNRINIHLSEQYGTMLT